MAYMAQDEWDYTPRGRPAPHHARTAVYLDTERGYEGRSRSRSYGAQPRPIINLYNEVINTDNHTDHVAAPAPPGAFPVAYPVAAAPPPPPAVQFVPTAYPAYDRGDDRGRRRNDDRLADELHLLRLDAERSHSRAHSRRRSNSSERDYYRYEVEKLEREKQWKRDQERIKAESDLKHMKDDMRRRQHDLDEEAERKRIIAEYDKKAREKTEREKSAERHLRDKIQREEKERKDKEEEAYQKFLAKQKAEKEKAEAAEKAEKAKFDAEMRKRLAEKGFAGNQIESILSDKKKETTTTTSTSVTVFQSDATPVYAKINKMHLSTDTLRYYNIPFRWDDDDDDYIIILREMSKHEINVLFEHTKAHREKRLLLEPSKKDNNYAFYRKRDRSKSRNRDSGWKSFGIIEYKK